MSHHSDDRSLTDIAAKVAGLTDSKDGIFQREKSALVQELKAANLQGTLGPTGDFPAGKVSPHDDGGLMMGVTNFSGRVVIDFGKPVRSIGFTRADALNFAKTLIERAKACPKIIGEDDPI